MTNKIKINSRDDVIENKDKLKTILKFDRGGIIGLETFMEEKFYNANFVSYGYTVVFKIPFNTINYRDAFILKNFIDLHKKQQSIIEKIYEGVLNLHEKTTFKRLKPNALSKTYDRDLIEKFTVEKNINKIIEDIRNEKKYYANDFDDYSIVNVQQNEPDVLNYRKKETCTFLSKISEKTRNEKCLNPSRSKSIPKKIENGNSEGNEYEKNIKNDDKNNNICNSTNTANALNNKNNRIKTNAAEKKNPTVFIDSNNRTSEKKHVLNTNFNNYNDDSNFNSSQKKINLEFFNHDNNYISYSQRKEQGMKKSIFNNASLISSLEGENDLHIKHNLTNTDMLNNPDEKKHENKFQSNKTIMNLENKGVTKITNDQVNPDHEIVSSNIVVVANTFPENIIKDINYHNKPLANKIDNDENRDIIDATQEPQKESFFKNLELMFRRRREQKLEQEKKMKLRRLYEDSRKHKGADSALLKELDKENLTNNPYTKAEEPEKSFTCSDFNKSNLLIFKKLENKLLGMPLSENSKNSVSKHVKNKSKLSSMKIIPSINLKKTKEKYNKNLKKFHSNKENSNLASSSNKNLDILNSIYPNASDYFKNDITGREVPEMQMKGSENINAHNNMFIQSIDNKYGINEMEEKETNEKKINKKLNIEEVNKDAEINKKTPKSHSFDYKEKENLNKIEEVKDDILNKNLSFGADSQSQSNSKLKNLQIFSSEYDTYKISKLVSDCKSKTSYDNNLGSNNSSVLKTNQNSNLTKITHNFISSKNNFNEKATMLDNHKANQKNTVYAYNSIDINPRSSAMNIISQGRYSLSPKKTLEISPKQKKSDKNKDNNTNTVLQGIQSKQNDNENIVNIINNDIKKENLVDMINYNSNSENLIEKDEVKILKHKSDGILNNIVAIPKVVLLLKKNLSLKNLSEIPQRKSIIANDKNDFINYSYNPTNRVLKNNKNTIIANNKLNNKNEQQFFITSTQDIGEISNIINYNNVELNNSNNDYKNINNTSQQFIKRNSSTQIKLKYINSCLKGQKTKNRFFNNKTNNKYWKKIDIVNPNINPKILDSSSNGPFSPQNRHVEEEKKKIYTKEKFELISKHIQKDVEKLNELRENIIDFNDKRELLNDPLFYQEDIDKIANILINNKKEYTTNYKNFNNLNVVSHNQFFKKSLKKHQHWGDKNYNINNNLNNNSTNCNSDNNSIGIKLSSRNKSGLFGSDKKVEVKDKPQKIFKEYNLLNNFLTTSNFNSNSDQNIPKFAKTFSEVFKKNFKNKPNIIYNRPKLSSSNNTHKRDSVKSSEINNESKDLKQEECKIRKIQRIFQSEFESDSIKKSNKGNNLERFITENLEESSSQGQNISNAVADNNSKEKDQEKNKIFSMSQTKNFFMKESNKNFRVIVTTKNGNNNLVKDIKPLSKIMNDWVSASEKNHDFNTGSFSLPLYVNSSYIENQHKCNP